MKAFLVLIVATALGLATSAPSLGSGMQLPPFPGSGMLIPPPRIMIAVGSGMTLPPFSGSGMVHPHIMNVINTASTGFNALGSGISGFKLPQFSGYGMMPPRINVELNGSGMMPSMSGLGMPQVPPIRMPQNVGK